MIAGDWKAWNFTIKNSADAQIGTISKKWAGAVKEIFTTADKYNVNIESNFANETAKVLVVSSAITIDMVLKEAK
ncbi:phospholipid scramblase-related protein [Bacteroidota bacterium]